MAASHRSTSGEAQRWCGTSSSSDQKTSGDVETGTAVSAPERSSVSEDNISNTEGNRFLPDAPVPLGDAKIASVQTIQTVLISSEEF